MSRFDSLDLRRFRIALDELLRWEGADGCLFERIGDSGRLNRIDGL